MDGNTINESTKLPLSFLITVLGGFGTILAIVIRVAISFTKLEAKVDNHEVTDQRRVDLIDARQEKYYDLLTAMDKRMSRIEGILETRLPK